jgi:hypothetical protein
MKKRIIILGLCFLLLLIFTSSVYAGFDPKYKQRAHPEQELKSPANEDQFDVFLLVLLDRFIFYSVTCTEDDSFSKIQNLQKIMTNKVSQKTTD